MNKLVYLFELDSVRKTTEEIELGQNALFDEIVMHGNTVVCTFNQITDSPVFLAILSDKNKYNEFLKLIKFGSIRISRYGKMRTPSQYIQQNLLKNIETGKNSFIFSSLPLKYDDIDLQKDIYQALLNSDLSIFEEKIKTLKSNKQEVFELQILKRYVELILTLSMQELSVNEPKNEDKISMSNFIDKLINIEEADLKKFSDDNKIVNNFKESCKILKSIFNDIGELKENRSVWINFIHSLFQKEQPKSDYVEIYKIAEAIIDLCYNYALEESILSVSKHYKNYTYTEDKSFFHDFFNRLMLYLNSCHNFLQPDSREFVLDNKFMLPEWEIATLIIQQVKNNKLIDKFLKVKNKNNTNSIIHYEENFRIEKIIWNSLIFLNLISHTLIVLLGIVAFFIFENLSSKVQEITIELLVKIPDVAKDILNIFIFVILITVISNKLKIPDILDSFKKILSNIKTIFTILKNKNDAYNNL